jgi:hypothetical protein
MLPSRWRDPLLGVGALLVSFLAIGAAVATMNFIFRDPAEPLRKAELAALSTLLANPPDSVVFADGSSTTTITEPQQVRQFLSLLLDPDPIDAHHTHPEGEILVGFADHRQVYLLGRDSRVPNEYWLQLQQVQQAELTLKRLRSRALTSWLYSNRILTRTRH